MKTWMAVVLTAVVACGGALGVSTTAEGSPVKMAVPEGAALTRQVGRLARLSARTDPMVAQRGGYRRYYGGYPRYGARGGVYRSARPYSAYRYGYPRTMFYGPNAGIYRGYGGFASPPGIYGGFGFPGAYGGFGPGVGYSGVWFGF
ncbi:MAG: hypothetical protein U0795_09755 [Pirellulales bacterium]